MNLKLALHWQAGGESVDPVLFALLAGIQESGSLRGAAQQLDISYRHAWGLMARWSRTLGQPLARMERGRGARLTALGNRLLWLERRARARLNPQLESLASELGNELNTVLRAADEAPLRSYASHDLTLGMMRTELARRYRVTLDLQYRGSLDSLRLLHGGQCDLAGFHIADGPPGERLAGQYRRWLTPKNDRLMLLVSRVQGLMLSDSARHVRNFGDLVRGNLRFVNRQPGSGTRLLFDELLLQEDIEPADVAGYDTEEFTHLAVAALVASGAADAGFGIEAAARQFQLNFVPMARERYYFALRAKTLERPAVRCLIELLKDNDFREQIHALQGYDAGSAGETLSIQDVFGGRPD